MLLRPRPGTSQKTVDAKTAMFSFILDQCEFKNQTKWGLEQMALQGTGIFKWGYDWKEIATYKRKATTIKIDAPQPDGSIQTIHLPSDVAPDISVDIKTVPLPFLRVASAGQSSGRFATRGERHPTSALGD